jgi:hypothetical protein
MEAAVAAPNFLNGSGVRRWGVDTWSLEVKREKGSASGGRTKVEGENRWGTRWLFSGSTRGKQGGSEPRGRKGIEKSGGRGPARGAAEGMGGAGQHRPGHGGAGRATTPIASRGRVRRGSDWGKI